LGASKPPQLTVLRTICGKLGRAGPLRQRPFLEVLSSRAGCRDRINVRYVTHATLTSHIPACLVSWHSCKVFEPPNRRKARVWVAWVLNGWWQVDVRQPCHRYIAAPGSPPIETIVISSSEDEMATVLYTKANRTIHYMPALRRGARGCFTLERLKEELYAQCVHNLLPIMHGTNLGFGEQCMTRIPFW
jgi:hypothetical protein